ncbi:histidine--tRNA ligase [Candidatus Woesearchaeota archaeon]|nr:histidine--tRNA ligase [Candidatus Woesearchaeota archaeon]
MKLQRAKGTRDFPPEEKILRNYVVDTLRRVFELYGFPPMETPIIERFDVLAAKYAGGAEILKEMFQLTDQGGRKLGLRYDLTVPFSRYVGMNPTMKMPFKRYAIGRVFRDGPIKLGRYREFWQCDCDVVGCKNMTAEVELINIALTAFERLGLNVRLEVNNRKLLDALLDALGISDNKKIDVILTIDKLKKIPRTELVKELKEKGLKNPDKLLNVFEVKGSNKEKIENIKKIIKEDSDCLKELEEIFALVKSKKVEFNPALARGLAYYTGTVFEVFMNNSDFTSSLMGGGRFDNMIADFLGTKKEFPAVGISFGVEPISEMLKLKKKRDERSVTKVFVIPIGTKKESMNIAAELRAQGINTEIDIMDRGISKNLDYANYYKIPFVVFAGEEELKKKKVKLKNMDTGEEKFLAVKDILKVVAD